MSSQINPVSVTAACAGAAAIILAAGAASGQNAATQERVVVLEEEHPVRVFVHGGGGHVDVDEDVIRILGPDGKVLHELDKRWLSDDGSKSRRMIWRDADADADVDVKVRGKTIIIGPDGEKTVREFGDEEVEIELEQEFRRHLEDGDIDRAMRELRRALEGLRLPHDAEVHMDDDHMHGMFERLHEHLGQMKDGDVHVEMRGKGVIIGPDGEMHEFDLDENEMHEWMGKLHGGDVEFDFDFGGAPFDGAWNFEGLPGEHGEEGRLFFRGLPGGGGSTAWLGIAMQPVSEDLASYFDLDAGAATRIGSVVDGSPAAKAGLRAKDIVVEVEGETTASAEAIAEAVAAREPGDEIELTVIRDGARRTVRVTLGERAGRAGRLHEAIEPRGPHGLFAVPDLPVPPAPQADGRIQDRLDRLEQQIERLERMMERLEDRPAERERRVRPRRQRRADPASIS